MKKELKEDLKRLSKWYVTYTILSRDPHPHKSSVIHGAFQAAKLGPPALMSFFAFAGLLTMGLTFLILSLSVFLTSGASELTESLLVAGLILTGLVAASMLVSFLVVNKKEKEFYRVEESLSDVISLPQIFIRTWARELRQEQREMVSPRRRQIPRYSRYRSSRSESPTWSASV